MMLRLAWRQLRLDGWRSATTALALSGVVAVILVLQGFEQGQYAQMARAVLDRGGDLIATQSGVDALFGRSSIPQLARADVEAVPGVSAVHPMTTVPVIYEKDGRRTPILIFVIDTKGGPVTTIEGRSSTDSRDVIVDRSLAALHRIQLGDRFVVSDFEFTVAGIAQGAAGFFEPFAFIGYDAMIDFFLESELAPDISAFPLVSFLLIDVEPTNDVDTVAAGIEALVPSVDVFRPERLAALNVALARGFLAPIMGLLVTVAYVIALVVAAMILYVDVSSRLRAFAVLKAVGFTPRHLSWTVLSQAALLFAVSLPVAAALAAGTGAAIEAVAPLYELRAFEPAALVQTLVGTALAASAGALVPLRTIRRADPMLAFAEP